MYDLKAIKSISIGDVASKYGIDLQKKHGRLWGKLRDENTSSFSINIDKNLWYDFGTSKGGSVIDLVAEIEGITSTEAINKLAEEYNFKNEITKGWSPLTDSQYKELGIIPEKATLNFNYDLNVHTPQQLIRWNDKYGMPLRDLADKMPDTYNKLVCKIAQKYIDSIREAYITKVKLSVNPTTTNEQKELYQAWAKIDSKEINANVDLLSRAIKDNPKLLTVVQSLKVNPELDFRLVNIQQNNNAYKDLSNDEKIRNKIVNIYKKLYNFKEADYLTIESAKALMAINLAISNSSNKYLAIHEIKELYNTLGRQLQKLEPMYSDVVKEGESIPKSEALKYKEWQTKAYNFKQDLSSIKDMFKICNSAVDGLREAHLAYKQDVAKQVVADKALGKSALKEIDLIN